MSYDTMIKYIIKEGEEKSAEILAKTREKVNAMLSEIGDKLQEKREHAFKELDTEIAEYMIKKINMARFKGNALISAAKGEIINDLYGEIGNALQSIIAGPLYPAILRQLLIEGLKEMHGKVDVSVNSRDCQLVRDFLDNIIVANCEVISIKGDDRIKGGVEIVSDDKSISIINTLRSRFEKSREDLLPEIGEILFVSDSSGLRPSE